MTHTAGADGSVRLWDAATCRQLGRLHTPQTTQTRVLSVAFSRDGTKLAAAGTSNEVTIWDVDTRRVDATLNQRFGTYAVAFGADASQLFTGDAEVIRVWDVKNRKELRRLEGHTVSIRCLAISPDGKTLASGAHDPDIKLWDIATGKQIGVLIGHEELWVSALAFTPDGKTIASFGGRERSLRIWDVQTRKLSKFLDKGANVRGALAVSPNGKTLAAADAANAISIWTIPEGRRVATLKGHKMDVRSLSFSSDGKLLVSGGGGIKPIGEVLLWKVR